MQIVRIVLKDSVLRQDIDRLADKSGWIFRNELQSDEETPYQKIWLTDDKKTSIHYIEDNLIAVRYLQAKGNNPDDTVRLIRGDLDTYNEGEICQLVKNSNEPNDCISAIYKACIAAPQECEPEFLKFFKKTLYHPRIEVRRAAIFATSYVAWREFKPILEDLKTLDPNIAKDAEVMLKGLEMYSWK